MIVAVDTSQLTALLGRCRPLGSMTPERLASAAERARLRHVARGELVLDAFTRPTTEVVAVLEGRVDLWNDPASVTPDESAGPGGIFGFSAMLADRSIGPRAVAATDATVAAIPSAAVVPAFISADGVKFLAERVAEAATGRPSTYTVVDELITDPPVRLEPGMTASQAAERMTAGGVSIAAVPLADGRYGLISDRILRESIIADGRPASTTVDQLMAIDPAMIKSGGSSADAMIMMLERAADGVLIVDDDGALRGTVGPLELMASSSTPGISLHEQLRRAASTEELRDRALRIPRVVGEMVAGGMAASKAIGLLSTMIDGTVRRAVQLIFADHPDLSMDAFTWLSLGSNGRREAVLSSDVDAAVVFLDRIRPEQIDRYRFAFAAVDLLLGESGLSRDSHGVSPANPTYSRTNIGWRTAAEEWLADPVRNEGAMMTSLLVDGRPIHGDPGLPAVARVFGTLRRNPNAMRLLLTESLSNRARTRTVWEVLQRSERFDIKRHALQPIVNFARWGALSVGSTATSTVERLEAVGGSSMLPRSRARILIEVFEVLQRIRLRYQLAQLQRGDRPSDLLDHDRLSPIDRSIITRAAREIAAIQRRADNISLYLPTEQWLLPESGPKRS